MSKDMRSIVRHGDVDFLPCDKPENVTLVTKTTSHVAQIGEVTGHHHTITAPDTFEIYRNDAGERFLLVTDAGATIVHPEHRSPVQGPGKIDQGTYAPGWYKQGQEVEEDPFTELVNQVVD